MMLENSTENNLPEELDKLAVLFRERASYGYRRVGMAWEIISLSVMILITASVILFLFTPFLNVLNYFETVKQGTFMLHNSLYYTIGVYNESPEGTLSTSGPALLAQTLAWAVQNNIPFQNVILSLTQRGNIGSTG